jgi:O-antigen/teichoic acid export membrane protein
VVKHVSHDIAVGDRHSARAVVGTSVALTVTTGVVAILVLNLSSAAIIKSVLRVTGLLAATAYSVVFLTSLTLGVGLVSGIYYSVLVALQRYWALAGARLVTATLLAVAQVALVRMGMGLTWLAAAGLVFGVLNLMLLVVYVAQWERALVFQPVVSKMALRKLVSFGAFRTVDMLATLMLMQIDRVIIGAQLGAAGIAFYSIPQGLAQQLSHMATSLTEPLFPRLSGMLATGDWRGVRSLYHKGTRLLAWFVITTVVCAIVLSDSVFRYWLGATFAAQAVPILRWLLVGWGTIALSLVAIFALNAFGFPEINAGVRVLQGIALVGACLVLVPKFGAVGAAYGLAGGMLLTVPLYMVYVDRKLELQSADVAVDLFAKPVLIGALVLAVGLALHQGYSSLIYDVVLLVLMPALSLGLALGAGTISRDESELGVRLLREVWGGVKAVGRRPVVASSAPRP